MPKAPPAGRALKHLLRVHPLLRLGFGLYDLWQFLATTSGGYVNYTQCLQCSFTAQFINPNPYVCVPSECGTWRVTQDSLNGQSGPAGFSEFQYDSVAGPGLSWARVAKSWTWNGPGSAPVTPVPQAGQAPKPMPAELPLPYRFPQLDPENRPPLAPVADPPESIPYRAIPELAPVYPPMHRPMEVTEQGQPQNWPRGRVQPWFVPVHAPVEPYVAPERTPAERQDDFDAMMRGINRDRSRESLKRYQQWNDWFKVFGGDFRWHFKDGWPTVDPQWIPVPVDDPPEEGYKEPDQQPSNDPHGQPDAELLPDLDDLALLPPSPPAIIASGPTEVAFNPEPFHKLRPPDKYTKERKYVVAIPPGPLNRLIGQLTESMDMVKCMHKALPKKYQAKPKWHSKQPDFRRSKGKVSTTTVDSRGRQRKGGSHAPSLKRMAEALYNHSEHINMEKVLAECALEQAGDVVVGALGRANAMSANRARRSSGFQLGPAL